MLFNISVSGLIYISHVTFRGSLRDRTNKSFWSDASVMATNTSALKGPTLLDIAYKGPIVPCLPVSLPIATVRFIPAKGS